MILALDIGGVCIDIDHTRCLATLGFPTDTPIPPVFHEACVRFERGLCLESEWLAAFQQITGGRFSDNELRQAFCAILGAPLPGIDPLLDDAVAGGIRLVFFSDTSELHLREVFRKYAFAPLVTGAVVSYEVHAHKPDPAMYDAFERKFGRPDYYIDDRPENVAAGLARGWPAHQFRSMGELRQTLGIK